MSNETKDIGVLLDKDTNAKSLERLYDSIDETNMKGNNLKSGGDSGKKK